MYVAHQGQQVLILLADYRFIAPLEQMANFAIPEVEVLGIRLLEPLHEFGQGDRPGFKQEVNVVGHQAIAKNFNEKLSFAVFPRLNLGRFCDTVHRHIRQLTFENFFA